MGITPQESARRRQVVDDVRHSSEMEGGRSSDEFREVQEAHVRGELGADEVVAAARRLAGLEPEPRQER